MPLNTSNEFAADGSNGYDAVADVFMSRRTESTIGVATVRRWTKLLPRAGAVLDLGCGHGAPISQILVDEGFTVFGVDASATMISVFRARFPEAPAEHCEVQDSAFFGRQFNGVMAWGLMFLLSEDAQARVIQKVAAALKPGGRFLFTAPRQACEWPDNLTRQTSRSLGSDAYCRLVESAGLILEDQAQDEGQNPEVSPQI
jgi:SAM-dependent methyltransferase